MWMLILILAWLGLFLWLDRGVLEEQSEKDITLPSVVTEEKVDAIIAFRNEAANLSFLLTDLFRSVTAARSLHIILIDDHSTDNGLQVIDQVMKTAPANVTYAVINSPGEGKKKALASGLNASSAPWVFFTDADCRIPNQHIEHLLGLAEKEKKEVVFGPVLIKGNTWFGQLQSIENLNTQAITESFLQKGLPLMVNGANMLLHANKKEAYLQSQHWGYPGGDDVFFAQRLSRSDYAYGYERAFAVTTHAMDDGFSFLQQRVRWVSKGRAYPHGKHLWFTAIYALLSLGFVLVLVLALASGSWWNVACLVVVVKWMIERTFHQRWSMKYIAALPWLAHLLISLVYPFYSLLIGVLSLLPMRFSWKGRSYSTKSTTT